MSKHHHPHAFLVVLALVSCSSCVLVFATPDLFDDVYHDSITRHNAWIIRAIGLLFVAQLVLSPLWGAMSDTAGRKTIMALACTLHSSIIIVLACIPSKYTFQGIFLLAGTLNVCFAMGYAMMADTSSKQYLTTSFGLVNAAFGVGLTCGLFVGHNLSVLHTKAPYLAAVMVDFLALLITRLYVTETLTSEESIQTVWQIAGTSIQYWRRHVRVFGVACILGFMHLGSAVQGIMYFYTNYRFGWQLRQHIIFVSFQGFGFVASLTIGLHFLTKRVANRLLLLLAILLQAIAYGATTFVSSGWQMYIVYGIGVVHVVGFPIIRSFASSLVDRQHQGALQGSLAAVSTIAMFFGEPLFKHIMRYSISDKLKTEHPIACPRGFHGVLDEKTLNCGGMPDLAFAVSSCMLMAVFALAYVIALPTPQKSHVLLSSNETEEV